MVEIVTPSDLKYVVNHLGQQSVVGFDTETTGIGMSDRLFSFAIATKEETFYFNFHSGEDHLGCKSPVVLDKEIIKGLPWKGLHYAHNAKFDLCMLRKEMPRSVEFECTMVNERILRNDFPSMSSYSLENTAKRYGLSKDMTIDAYIKEHSLYDIVKFNGEDMDKVPRFYKVPFEKLAAYAGLDARLALEIGLKQDEKFATSSRD
jgi:DNA polymerase III epsilon subunit-like protein